MYLLAGNQASSGVSHDQMSQLIFTAALIKKILPGHVLRAVFPYAFCTCQPTHGGFRFFCSLDPRAPRWVMLLRIFKLLGHPQPCDLPPGTPPPSDEACASHFCHPWILLPRPLQAVKPNGAYDGRDRKGVEKSRKCSVVPTSSQEGHSGAG